MERNTQLRALIVGATGATGRELTELLLGSKYYSEVAVIVRRKLEKWDTLNIEQKEKLNFILCEDLGVLNNDKEELKRVLKNDFKYDSVFCCLGSRVGNGEAEFTRVDYDFFVYSADLCEKFNIPHYSCVSAQGVNANSWFLYSRVKGRADEACMKKNIPYVSILRPGLIVDRDNGDSRFGEKVLKCVPFLPKIRSIELAQALMNDDINFHLNLKADQTDNVQKILYNKDLLKLANLKI